MRRISCAFTAILLCLACASALAQEAGISNVLVRDREEPRGIRRTFRVTETTREDGEFVRDADRAGVKFSYGEFDLMQFEELEKTEPGVVIIPIQEPDDGFRGDIAPEKLGEEKFNHLLELMPPVRDQGKRPTCSTMACTALVESLVKKARLKNAEGYKAGSLTFSTVYDPDFSEQWLWSEMCKKYNRRLTAQGSWPTENMATLENGFFVPEMYWPYAYATQPKPSIVDDLIAKLQKPETSIPGFSRVRVASVTTYRSDNIVASLKANIDKGYPTVVAVDWFGKPLLKNGIVFVPDKFKDKTALEIWKKIPGATSIVGHSVLVVGYGKLGTDAEGFFLFRNSWSESFGVGGYGFMTEAYVKKFLWQALTAEIEFENAPEPPEQPEPPKRHGR